MTAEEKKTIEMLRQIKVAVEGQDLPLGEFPLNDFANLIRATLGREFIGVSGGMKKEEFQFLIEGYLDVLQHSLEQNDVAGCVKVLALLETQYMCFDRVLNAYRDQRYVEPYKEVTVAAGEAYSEVQYYMHERKRKKDMAMCDLGTCGKGVVYTCALFCNHGLQQPEYINPEWDYICFTNDKEKIGSKDGVWEYRGIEVAEQADDETLFHLCAIKPYLLLPEYDYSIWVNPNYRISGDLELFMASYGRNVSFLAFPSYVADDIYDMLYTTLQNDEMNIRVRKKGLQYQKEGYPQHDCMIHDAIIIRNHRDPEMCQVMENWWDEAMQCGRLWSYGFNYVAWMLDFDFAICDLFVEKNPFFKSMLIDLEVRSME